MLNSAIWASALIVCCVIITRTILIMKRPYGDPSEIAEMKKKIERLSNALSLKDS